MKMARTRTSKVWVKTEVKPISQNQAHYGRKTKTAAYRKYEGELIARLPDIEIPEGELQLDLVVRYSSPLSDLDNALKPFIDVLQKRYHFNDRHIYKIIAIKRLVKKGEEGITFRVKNYVQKET